MKSKNILAFFCCLALVSCAGSRKFAKTFSGDAGEIIIAEGMAPIIDNDLIGAKKTALLEAQKTAVELVVGVYISAQTRVEKAVVIDAGIIAKTQGYVARYEVLSEKKDAGFYKTKIKALVKLDDISKDLKNLGLSVTPEDVGNPKVAVLLDELIDGEENSPSDSEAAIIGELIKKGYKIIESSSLSEKQVQGVLQGEKNYYKELADKLQAEVLIIGKSESSFFTDQNLGGFISYRAAVQARVVKAQTAEVLLSVSNEASGVDVVKRIAAKKSLTIAGELAGKELAQKIAEKLKAYADITVNLQNIKRLNQVEGLIQEMRKQSFVKDAVVQTFSNSEAVLTVRLYSDDSKKLAGVLENFKQEKITVSSLNKYQITAELGLEEK